VTTLNARRRGVRLSVWQRTTAWVAIAAARPLAALPPRRIRKVLEALRSGASPATVGQTRAARDAVTTVSIRCWGEYCVQRSLATALLCRLRGVWPTWCVGVRANPFSAHAWVEVDGEPVGEPYASGDFARIMIVPPATRAE
jgi:transglutaminase superfamily protein